MTAHLRARFAGLVLPAMLLSACSGYYGTSEEAPLPGERKSVMLLDERIVVDPRVDVVGAALIIRRNAPDQRDHLRRSR